MDVKDKKGIAVYSDLLIWKEIVKKSRTEKKHVILVTGDVKEDWFLKSRGKTLGPRPELIQEFKKETAQIFYVYPTDQFLEFSNSYLKSNIEQKIIDEVGQVLTEQKNNNDSEATEDVYIPENTTISIPNFGEINNSGNVQSDNQTEQTFH
ncbi:hypothetical protein Barb4_00030 [Bacteroidales bacterium Barb4]|nr:hypothetical protein Barb4_00030 [Bacteroidales bacterium Barb4]